MFIIQLESQAHNFHPHESQSHRSECWEEGYIAVPPALVPSLEACEGYCDLLVVEGVLTAISPKAKPAAPTPLPTAGDDIEAMLIDQEYRLTLLEQGGL